ncbi:ABC transporter substrate-binding protein [Anaeromicropila populeti]|uniref:Carbohydrate ABC transporter substrate-binding protein, CUT1 family (TC 3.A.1.1.-) n=1 Tax=Anaeromicropila populeti TaxID=37658 RepID=A0A1I6IGA2_9FIRM|nr:ABC transporter substrate-binding protein [Anaeromicropila populeti]SFR65684.1 carbohydrate ABC transporter substrate-binding protein, CUT1 family (TC 3.A.1.1.-) [Anaeromicropila populeti]
MKNRIRALFVFLFLGTILGSSAGCHNKLEQKKEQSNTVKLIWYQIGEPQKDLALVQEKVNEYTAEKIGVTVQIEQIGWDKYTKTMETIVKTGKEYDLVFTSSWANDYLTNAQRGFFLPLDELLQKYGKEMYEAIDDKFWEAAMVDGRIYGVPNEKELGSMPMWVFTKEYVDKYHVPYEDIHTLEDLEPWLELISENEPDVVPLYITQDFSAPTYMDKIQDIVGIEYDDTTLTVQNLFHTDRMLSTLRTMRNYYLKGYINKNAAMETDSKEVKRFVTKGDGQPYAELIWSKDLGYEVVTSNIMEVQITNVSARGALTAISSNTKHPKEAVEFLNLVNTDEYLRNLLNYGIEGIHYDKTALSEDDEKLVEGKENTYSFKVHLNSENQKNYSVPYWVQGGLFNTYVLETEPIDKWYQFQQFNKELKPALSFGFNFDSTNVLKEILEVKSVLNEYGTMLYSGSVDPDLYVPKLNQKLESAGIQTIIDDMQKQVDDWKKTAYP